MIASSDDSQSEPAAGQRRSPPNNLLTQEQMIGRGAYGFLTHAFECIIPVEKVTQLLPDPVCEGWGAYSHADHGQPLEVQYSLEEDIYLLYAGNVRLKDAVRRGEKTIRAFVETDRGQVGPVVQLLSLTALGEERQRPR